MASGDDAVICSLADTSSSLNVENVQGKCLFIIVNVRPTFTIRRHGPIQRDKRFHLCRKCRNCHSEIHTVRYISCFQSNNRLSNEKITLAIVVGVMFA